MLAWYWGRLNGTIPIEPTVKKKNRKGVHSILPTIKCFLRNLIVFKKSRILLVLFLLISNDFKDMEKLSKSIEAFCVLYGINLFWSWKVLRIHTLSWTNHSFVNILKLLKNPRFYLVDTYPLLCRVITITVATLISSERAFSILKRVKSGLRLSMLQRRLETLLLIVIEKANVADLDKNNLTDAYSKSSLELSRCLIQQFYKFSFK